MNLLQTLSMYFPLQIKQEEQLRRLQSMICLGGHGRKTDAGKAEMTAKVGDKFISFRPSWHCGSVFSLRAGSLSVLFERVSWRLLQLSECNLMLACLLSPRSTVYSDKQEDIYDFYLFKV